MHKELIIINAIIFLYILQRLSEILISKKNEEWLISHLDAYEVSSKQSQFIKLFHIAWFLCLIIESNIKAALHPHPVIIYAILFLSQFIRFHTINKLKHFWTIKLFKMNHHQVINSGLYQYVRHPNYMAVILELLFLPLLLQSYFTMITFTLGNLFLINNRIKTEEDILMSQSNYNEAFKTQRKLIPFVCAIFLLVFSSIAHSTEIEVKYNNYEDAQKSSPYIRFSSTSTKLGFITTSFDGFAKSFKYNYELEGKNLKSIIITIDAKSFDTDSNGRNEKMNDEILNSKEFAQIIAKLKMPLELNEGSFTTAGTFIIKNFEFNKPIKYEIKKINNKFQIKGSTTISLKEAQLPDPSIAIAKVRDDFDLSFVIEL